MSRLYLGCSHQVFYGTGRSHPASSTVQRETEQGEELRVNSKHQVLHSHISMTQIAELRVHQNTRTELTGVLGSAASALNRTAHSNTSHSIFSSPSSLGIYIAPDKSCFYIYPFKIVNLICARQECNFTQRQSRRKGDSVSH